MIHEIFNRKHASSLSDGWDETLIWSCLQGVMGNIYADDLYNPTAAMAVLGDFTFFAGKPSIEIVFYKPDWCTQDFMIMVLQNEGWVGICMWRKTDSGMFKEEFVSELGCTK